MYRNRCSGVFLMVCILVFSIHFLRAQSGAVIPQGGVGHAKQASCVILKRMGPADEVTSHLYSFGIRGKQFQFVEGKLPDGFPFHGRLTDHDARNLQGRGAEVLMLEPHYTAEDLKEARAQCKAMTGEDPQQTSPDAAVSASGEKASDGPKSLASRPSITPAPVVQSQTAIQASLTVESTPAGADIDLDGAFVGNTPSTVNVAPGKHEIAVKKKSYVLWNRTLNVTGGNIRLSADLDKEDSK